MKKTIFEILIGEGWVYEQSGAVEMIADIITEFTEWLYIRNGPFVFQGNHLWWNMDEPYEKGNFITLDQVFELWYTNIRKHEK